MKEKIQIFSILLFFTACVSLSPKIRDPIVAGQFYPAQGETLSAQIESFLAKTQVEAPSEGLQVLIVPHAGYVYSGQVAAEAYSLVKGKNFQSVVIIAPSHRYRFEGVSIYPQGGYKTPLGVAEIDESLASRLSTVSGFNYIPAAHEKEHAVEVQIPFIQKTLPQAKIVPVVMGNQTSPTITTLAKSLSKVLPGENALVIASTDMSHYLPKEKARAKDSQTISLIKSLKTKTLMKKVTEGENIMCGGGPVVSALVYAQEKGKPRVKILKYADSSQSGGPRNRVVGYLSAAVYTSSPPGASSFSLSGEEKERLLELAQSAITLYIKENKILNYHPQNPKFLTKKGVFVTIEKKGELRGCIGFIEPRLPLYQTLIQAAVFASTKDARFPPVSPDELDDLKIEISILSSLKKINNPGKIEVGKHGLVVTQGDKKGLLLPQVAVENGWSGKTFLDQACLKAGLRPDCWKKGADIYIFEAIVFHQPETFPNP